MGTKQGSTSENWQCLIKHGLRSCCSVAQKIVLPISIWDLDLRYRRSASYHCDVVEPDVGDASAQHLVKYHFEFIILPLLLSTPLPYFLSPPLSFSASKTHGCGGWDKRRSHPWAKNQDFRWSGLWDCFFCRRVRTVARAIFFLHPTSLPPPVIDMISFAVCMWSLWSASALPCPWPVLFGFDCHSSANIRGGFEDERWKNAVVCILKLKLSRCLTLAGFVNVSGFVVMLPVL